MKDPIPWRGWVGVYRLGEGWTLELHEQGNNEQPPALWEIVRGILCGLPD